VEAGAADEQRSAVAAQKLVPTGIGHTTVSWIVPE
jgi:hypothetical protein